MKYTKREFPNQQVCVEVTINGFDTPFMAWVDDLVILSDDNIKEVNKQAFVAYLATKGYAIVDKPYKEGLWTFWLERNSAVHVGQQEW